MGYSPSAQAGIKQHGVIWKHTIFDVPKLLLEVDAAKKVHNSVAINAAMRRIAGKFGAYFDDDNASSGEVEALEWFTEEDSDYWMESDDVEGFEEEFNYRLGELYDFADFNRIWVKPDFVPE